jgi:hypothetical protein
MYVHVEFLGRLDDNTQVLHATGKRHSCEYDSGYIYTGGAKKCIHILRDVIYVLLFEVELNYGSMCSRTFAQNVALIK